MKLVAEGMERALDGVKGKARLLVEITAGQGKSLGWRFEHVAAIRAAIPGAARRRVGVCFDTCHAFAAGYDLAHARPATSSTFARVRRRSSASSTSRPST